MGFQARIINEWRKKVWKGKSVRCTDKEDKEEGDTIVVVVCCRAVFDCNRGIAYLLLGIPCYDHLANMSLFQKAIMT